MEEKRYSLWHSSENRWYNFTTIDGRRQDRDNPLPLTWDEVCREYTALWRTSTCEIREVSGDWKDQERRKAHADKWL